MSVWLVIRRLVEEHAAAVAQRQFGYGWKITVDNAVPFTDGEKIRFIALVTGTHIMQGERECWVQGEFKFETVVESVIVE